MMELWEKYFYLWHILDWKDIIKWGWYIFILDIPRFFVIEGITLYWSRSERKKTKDLWDKAREDLFDEMPLVTVLVPGHNEGKHLFKLVQSMNRQTYTNLELVVVDDGSTDDTAIIASSFEKSGLIDVFLSAAVRGGKASAANLGLRYSKGKYVVHLDADSSLESDAIEKILIPFYRYENVGGVGGNLVVRNGEESLTTMMQFLEYLQTISVSRIVLSKLKIYKIISGAFGAFPRHVLNRVGGWDIGPGLDGDITVKIRKIDYRILFEEEAICRTHAPVTWKALTKQRLRWSRSLIRFRLRKHNDIWQPNKNFKIINFLSFFENVFFSLVLDLLWFFYMFKILITDPSFMLIWFPFKYTIYLFMTLGQYSFVFFVNKDKKYLFSKIIYIPLYPLYMGYYMRIVRTISYIDEFFFYDSYKDVWNPLKTSKKAKEHGM
ncbi:glycosyltransferase family 2 protein [Paenimyroides tangerinum]|uniref:Glycosyltransferase family 2 protein n=1 Tax=Paenimyroides tangerinum TaxID=2488728 RepID=A0A3P3W7M3_9FLAO|nr:glycosyltransferase [Paenimyroides tangerinum]RRJ91172.1 glycosyltransferase family 2 protein [Paenimyroides tangerinum]